MQRMSPAAFLVLAAVAMPAFAQSDREVVEDMVTRSANVCPEIRGRRWLSALVLSVSLPSFWFRLAALWFYASRTPERLSAMALEPLYTMDTLSFLRSTPRD